MTRASAQGLALGLFLATGSAAVGAGEQPLKYPTARKADAVDDYHGTKVADPYRWLEDADDKETAAWVEAQNALTQGFVAGPTREALKKRLAELIDYPRMSAPEKKGSRYFYSRNSGLQNQAVLLVREGQGGAERVLLDPNALSADGTVALASTSYTRDGSLMAYTLSRSGSDRQEIYVREVATGKDLPDKLLWAKFTNLTWTPDRKGFYYMRFPAPGSVPAGEENYAPKVYYHRLGEPQDSDRLVFERPDDKQLVFGTAVTRDGRYLVIAVVRGASDKAEVFVQDLKAPGAKPSLLPFTKGLTAAWDYLGESGGRFYFRTDQDAPLGRIAAVDLTGGGLTPVAIVPQGSHKLASANLVNGKLVLQWLQNASDRLEIRGLDGRLEKSLELPALGTVAELNGEPDEPEMFFSFTSFTYPTTPFRYDFASGTLSAFEKSQAKVDSTAYQVSQVFYPSKDGTKVSLFLVHQKGLAKDGKRPTLLYGYGGFNISLTPAFSASRFAWLERGGVLAIANLRGGGEYGEAWHEAGMLERKQNVFDDFIAAGEWLIASGYTNPSKLAIQGGSNGGLLVGAVMVQRPDLLGAVVCQVPVADMLRYHLFTVGRYWIPEYGSSENPQQFPFLYRYSPYHNVKDGTGYPATLVATADTDDRVAPGMAKKFAARLQAASDGKRPILIRVETKAGHGAGKPVSKQIDEQADVYAFLLKALGEV